MADTEGGSLSSFSELLGERMEASGFSSRGLSLRANELAGDLPGWRPLHSDGDGIENWLRPRRSWRGRVIRPRYWLQLAAIARVLGLDETEAQHFFSTAGWSLEGLRVKASAEQRWLLDFGQPPLLDGEIGVAEGAELVSLGGALVPYRDGERLPARIFRPFQKPRSRWLPVAAVVGSIAIFGSVIAFRPASSRVLLVEQQALLPAAPTVSLEVGSPPLPVVPIGKTCLISFADQPYEANYVSGVLPNECPEMSIWNQYNGYEGEDLLPWDQGTAQCYAGPPLVRLWVGFNLGDNSQGWLPLTPSTSADIFREDRPVNPELRDKPDTSAPSIGTFTYDELNGQVFAVQLDLPVTFDLSLAREQGDYHLGGCWQQADRDGARGINFFWPPGVNP